MREHRMVHPPSTTSQVPELQSAASRAKPVAGPQPAPSPAATGSPPLVCAHTDDALGRVLARAVERRATASPQRATLQRTITVDTATYSAATLAAALKADEAVVWHDAYVAELASLDAANETFEDHGELMMWLAGATMAAKQAPAPVPAVAAQAPPQVGAPQAEPKKKGKGAGRALTPTQVTLAELNKAAPFGATAGQRYDRQAETHTSVTFRSVRPDVMRIVGFHRTLANGAHIFWNKHAGDGRFKLSSDTGSPIETIARTKGLEEAWKAVQKVAAKLRCEAVEPNWT